MDPKSSCYNKCLCVFAWALNMFYTHWRLPLKSVYCPLSAMFAQRSISRCWMLSAMWTWKIVLRYHRDSLSILANWRSRSEWGEIVTRKVRPTTAGDHRWATVENAMESCYQGERANAHGNSQFQCHRLRYITRDLFTWTVLCAGGRCRIYFDDNNVKYKEIIINGTWVDNEL